MSLRKLRGLLALVTGVAVLASLAACGGQEPTATSPPPTEPPMEQPTQAPTDTPLEALIAGANAEGDLNIFGSSNWGNPAMLQAIQREMEREYGVNIRVYNTPGPSNSELVQRVISEHQAGRVSSLDVLFGWSAKQATPVQQAGVATEINWRAYAPYLLDEEIGPGNSSIVVGGGLHGIGYNKDLVDESDLPQTFEDFADPKYKGMIVTTPYGVGWIEAVQAVGEEKVLDVMNRMIDNGSVVGIAGCGQEDRVATGEFAMFAYNCGQLDWEHLQREGANVGWHFLPEFVSGTTSECMVPKNSGRPNAATLLCIFMTTPLGQDLVYEHAADMPSVYREGSRTYELVEELKAGGTRIFYNGQREVTEFDHIFKEVADNKIKPIIRRASGG